MQKLNRNEAFVVWDQWWQALSIEWFKVEVLQDYHGEDKGPSLDAWLAGDKEKSIKLLKSSVDSDLWLEKCKNKVSQGVKLIRIHVVEKPYTPYIEWELAAYEHRNIPYGKENVYLVNKDEALNLNLPDGDLMIFDKKRAIVNSYTKDGYCTHESFYEEGEIDRL